MAQSLLELIFGAGVLNDSQIVEKFGTMKYDRYAQDLFLGKGQSHSDLVVENNVARWQSSQLSREPAPFTGAHAPSVSVQGVDTDMHRMVMADIRISSQPIPIELITSKTAGMNMLATKYKNLRKRVGISKEILAWQSLKGSVNVNNTTVPGSEVSFAYTQNVTTHGPTAAWSTVGTPLISSEFETMHQVHHDASGLEIAQVVADGSVKGYIAANNEVQTMLVGGERKSDRLAKTNAVLGPAFRGFELNGYDWDVHSAKYSASGTLTKYLGADQLVALPSDEDLPSVLGYAEGYGAIPEMAFGALAGDVGMQAPNRGDYAYAFATPDPAAVVIVMGWRGAFFLTHPEAVLTMADVTTP